MGADSHLTSAAAARPSRLLSVGLWLIALGFVTAGLSGPVTRTGLISFKIGMPALGIGFLLLVAGALLAVVGSVAGSKRTTATQKRYVALAILSALVAVGYMITWVRTGTSAPPILEVSTDLVSPPPFVAIRTIRDSLPGINPSGYVAEVAIRGRKLSVPMLQRAAYPDLQPLRLALAPEEAFKLAENAARKMGWEIVAAVPGEGRLEATATTPFFGFKDDIVVRLRPEAGGTRVDVRSKSRVGGGDAGTNARRVRAYLALLRP